MRSLRENREERKRSPLPVREGVRVLVRQVLSEVAVRKEGNMDSKYARKQGETLAQTRARTGHKPPVYACSLCPTKD